MAGFAVSRNGGGGGGGFTGGRRGPAVMRQAPRRVVAAPRTVTSARPVTVTPRGEFVSHYDPSRVIDLDRLKVVKDMRGGPEFGEGRGDTTSGDNGVMSPSEKPSGLVLPAGGGPITDTQPGQIGGGGLALAALAAFLLLGG